MKNLIKLLFLAFFITGCNTTEDTNSPIILELPIFKEGKAYFSTGSDSIIKEIKGEIIPEKGNSFSFTQERRITSGGTDCLFPLYLNDEYKCFGADCKTRENFLDEEIFTLKINYLQQEIFNKKIKLKYRKTNSFDVFDSASFFDKEDNVWKPYKPEKISLLNEKGEPTNYEIEVKFVP
ncbi:hypothetical protein EQP59_10075 [Ornithobacterium rhinotracheale]|uniref:Lipoprotein n=1 Tax=Ornithobacterium rhinotracheale TaxID=28251 RepID=A0A410JTY5_ORNRH|nr:hypothetical protein [Ornithobacterium rhinotracheale]QAR31662.1 hypothetical protein EQP59_10075 [Ornithobacterium rhinotracheale]